MDRDRKPDNQEFMDQWNADLAPGYLKTMQKASMDRVNFYLDWYKTTKRSKANKAKAIRFICIIFFIVTVLSPIASSLVGQSTLKISEHKIKANNFLLNFGYVAVALGAGLLSIDRFYGYSSGWIRMNATLAELGDAKRDFEKLYQAALLLHPSNTQDGFQALSDTLKSFDDKISGIVKAEADQWATEFRAGNDELQKIFKDYRDNPQNLQSSILKTGDLGLTITDYALYNSIKLYINDVSKGDVIGGATLVSSLPPDNYKLRIEATLVEGKPKVKSTNITIKPGILNSVEIKLS